MTSFNRRQRAFAFTADRAMGFKRTPMDPYRERGLPYYMWQQYEPRRWRRQTLQEGLRELAAVQRKCAKKRGFYVEPNPFALPGEEASPKTRFAKFLRDAIGGD